MGDIKDDISRILRTGHEFSTANQKLRQSVDNLITRLAKQWGEETIPNWKVSHYGGDGIGISFPAKMGNYIAEVRNDSPAQPMEIVHRFCETLAGEEGKKLLDWLEEKTRQRLAFTQLAESLIVE